MRNSCKILMLLCLIGLNFGSCTPEDTAIYDEQLNNSSSETHEEQVDDELEPN